MQHEMYFNYQDKLNPELVQVCKASDAEFQGLSVSRSSSCHSWISADSTRPESKSDSVSWFAQLKHTKVFSPV